MYDVAANLWSLGVALPVALDHMGVAAVDGKLYVIGGYGGDFVARDEVCMFDPKESKWFAREPMPGPRGACWAVAFKDSIFVFGGVDRLHRERAETFIYDPLADGWSQGADMLAAREHLTAVAVGDFIYVIGGRSGGVALAANERYDPQSNTWAMMSPMPTARSATATAALGAVIMVAGGEVPMLHAVNEAYNVARDEWITLEPMPVPRHGVAAVPLGDHILVPAGGVEQGFGPTNYVDLFAPPRLRGDANGDFDVDRSDFADFFDCFGGPGEATAEGCEPADVDLDGMVSLADFAMIQDGFTGEF